MTSRDQDHLRLLSIGYFILGALSLLGAVGIAIPLFVLQTDMPDIGGDEVAIAQMVLYIVMGVVLVYAVVQVATGYFLLKERNWLYCMVIAGLTCLSFPLGTALGVFTFMVLTRPQVRSSFEV